jgi:hypothetical protein
MWESRTSADYVCSSMGRACLRVKPKESKKELRDGGMKDSR